MNEVIVTPARNEGSLPFDENDPAREGMYRSAVDVTTPNGVTETIWAIAETPSAARLQLKRRIGLYLANYWGLWPAVGRMPQWHVVDLFTGEQVPASEAVYAEWAGHCREGYRSLQVPVWAVQWAIGATGALLLINRENERYSWAPVHQYAAKWED